MTRSRGRGELGRRGEGGGGRGELGGKIFSIKSSHYKYLGEPQPHWGFQGQHMGETVTVTVT